MNLSSSDSGRGGSSLSGESPLPWQGGPQGVPRPAKRRSPSYSLPSICSPTRGQVVSFKTTTLLRLDNVALLYQIQKDIPFWTFQGFIIACRCMAEAILMLFVFCCARTWFLIGSNVHCLFFFLSWPFVCTVNTNTFKLIKKVWYQSEFFLFL